jgi:hypothetical protein
LTPSAIINSGETSRVGMLMDPFLRRGRQSDKVFLLPNRATEAASKIGKLGTNVQVPARDIHITRITATSLLSTAKYADAGYTTVFHGNQFNIYNQQDTDITVSSAAIIHRW